MRITTVPCALLLVTQLLADSTQPSGMSGRTFMDNELGSIFGIPNGYTWSDLGAYVGAPRSDKFARMAPEALKIVHGRFHIFKPSDDTTWVYFPYSQLKSFEAQERAAGRPPIFITATYQGKKRPVVMSWSLKLSGSRPTAPSTNWEYAVNVGDERFINFWINRYVRPILLKGTESLANVWVGLDECAFLPGLYGVIDDSGNFVSVSNWDSPFPKNETEYINSINTFFTRVSQLAPDLKVMPNLGSMTWSLAKTAYGAAAGLMGEDIYLPGASAFARDKIYNQFMLYTWLGDQGKSIIMRSRTTPGDSAELRTAYLIYAMLKSKNTTFAPMQEGSATSINPALYVDLHNRLGNPVAPLASVLEPGNVNQGFRLYSRLMEGGIVYLNWTGKTKTITLPVTSTLYNLSGQRVTTLTVTDQTAAAVFYSAGTRTQRPAIAPRNSSEETAPATVAMHGPTGSVIRYTTNGAAVTATSPAYSAPFNVYNNTVVNAKSFPSSGTSSFTSTAVVAVRPSVPNVQFLPATATGPAGQYYPVISLNSSYDQTVSVRYTVQPPSGSPYSGTISFSPGDIHQWMPINMTGAKGQVTRITLSSPGNSVIGTNYQFAYTIQ